MKRITREAAMGNSAGYSLIEILVVITIIGLLIAISAGTYSSFVTRGEIAKTRNLLENLKVYAEEYNNIMGSFPPSTLSQLGVSTTGDTANEGIEAFVLALYRKGYSGPRPDSASELVNTDDDEANKNVSDFGTRVLLEFQDAWGNPIVYFNSRDYGKPFPYFLENPEVDRETVEIRALKNPVTGTYFNFDSYQIVSIGPDGVFDTEDDICNFTRQE